MLGAAVLPHRGRGARSSGATCAAGERTSGQLPIGGPLDRSSRRRRGGRGRGDVEGARGLMRSRAFSGPGDPVLRLRHDNHPASSTRTSSRSPRTVASARGHDRPGGRAARGGQRHGHPRPAGRRGLPTTACCSSACTRRAGLAARAADVRRGPRSHPLRARRASTVAPTQWLAARYVSPRTVGLAFGWGNGIQSARARRSARGSRGSSTTRRAATAGHVSAAVLRVGALSPPHAAPAGSGGRMRAPGPPDRPRRGVAWPHAP